MRAPGHEQAAELGGPAAERRRYALRDLEEIDEQLAAGELDEETAARLRTQYEAELAALEHGDPPEQQEPVDAPDESRHDAAGPPSSRRALIGALLLIGALTAVIIGAAQVFRSDDGTGAAAGGVDVSEADAAGLEELEDLLASHPESTAMRLALADLYFDDGNYRASLPHYLDVLEGDPTPGEESRALGRIGWMAHITGQSAAAVDYLGASLEADPDNGEGKLFLAMVLFEGQGDAAGAIPLLEDVLALPGLDAEMRRAVEAVLGEARSVVESP